MDEAKARENIEVMKSKADYLTDESVEATRRMKALVEESGDIGAKTMVKLHEQGEQLDDIENNLEQMDADIKQAERHLNQMEKCCGLCLCCCTKGNQFQKKHGDLHKMAYNEKGGKSGSGGASNGAASARGTGATQQGPMVQKVLNDEREDEMDKNLNDVSNMLSTLKGMASDMGNELERQNDQLDRINMKADSNQVRLDEANDQAKRIIKK